VETDSRKACRIAQDEIQAGKVRYVVPDPVAPVVEAAPPEPTEE